MSKKNVACGFNFRSWNIGFEILEPREATFFKINLLCFEIIFAKWKPHHETTESRISALYHNCKHNRDVCGKYGRTNLEYFWSGKLSMLHTICEFMGWEYKWMKSRVEDFNNYTYSDDKMEERHGKTN